MRTPAKVPPGRPEPSSGRPRRALLSRGPQRQCPPGWWTPLCRRRWQVPRRWSFGLVPPHRKWQAASRMPHRRSLVPHKQLCLPASGCLAASLSLKLPSRPVREEHSCPPLAPPSARTDSSAAVRSWPAAPWAATRRRAAPRAEELPPQQQRPPAAAAPPAWRMPPASLWPASHKPPAASASQPASRPASRKPSSDTRTAVWRTRPAPSSARSPRQQR
mmetsp:Transcript_44095/g.93886  ORF Transcript_44095/g.93886 Transcript_44095/m.93886 type:complete len:218 (+) Transcript_44095:253-906(+)